MDGKSGRLGAALAVWAALLGAGAAAQEDIDRNSTVYIEVDCVSQSGGAITTQTGSGVIVSPDGFLITARHVVACLLDQPIENRLGRLRGRIGYRYGRRGDVYDLDLIRETPGADIAVLRFLGPPQTFHAAGLCAERHPREQSEFRAAGFPLAQDHQVVRGVIGSDRIPGGGWAAAAPFAPGMSGGPVYLEAATGRVAAIIKGGLADDRSTVSHITPIWLGLDIIQAALGEAVPNCAGATPPPPDEWEDGAPRKECPVCPEMVAVPGGSFQMGSPDSEPGRNSDEGPVHRVTAPRFAIGRTEVTFAQWDACVADGGCGGYRPEDQGWGRDDRPVINVSWQDAQAYVAWLNGKVDGSPYRLPSEAEWEYAARAGTDSAYPWGKDWSAARANGAGDKGRTVAIGSYPANRFGLRDMIGNVWEWTQDCWNNSYSGAPSNGSAWTSGDCSAAVLRGGA